MTPDIAEQVSVLLEPLDPDMQLAVLASMIALAATDAGYEVSDVVAWITAAFRDAESGPS